MTHPVRTVDRVSRGVVSAFGAGLFLGLAPASALAGWWLVAGMVLAAALAILFVLSTPDQTPGVTAVSLGILGRIAAAVAVASAFGAYVVPERPEVGAVALVVLVSAVVLFAPPLPAGLDRAAAIVVVVVLALVVVSCFSIAPVTLAIAPPVDAPGADEPLGLLPATVLLFLCFTGTGRPTRRERVLATVVVAVLSVAVAVAVLHQLGGERLALSPVPLRDALAAADATSVTGLLAVGVTIGCAFGLRGTLADVRDLAQPVVPRPVFAVGLAALAAALGVVLLDPVHALVGASVLLLGEAVIRLLAGRRRRA